MNDMKVLVQLRPIINAARVDGRKAWVGKDNNNKLTIESIYTTKDTAKLLTELDLLELATIEVSGVLKILDIYKR